jgi:hypothetical protein
MRQMRKLQRGIDSNGMWLNTGLSKNSVGKDALYPPSSHISYSNKDQIRNLRKNLYKVTYKWLHEKKA